MTFNLTGECLFCHKKRLFLNEGDFLIRWETLLKVYYAKSQHEWEDKKDKVYESGWNVTVCRECRKTHTIEDLIKAAKEVF